MTAGVKTIIYPVKDIAKAKALFTALLGVEPYADEPYYVGFKDAGQDIGLDPNGHSKGLAGPVPFWHVDDIQESLAALLGSRRRDPSGGPGRGQRQADRVGEGHGRQPDRADPGPHRLTGRRAGTEWMQTQ